MSSTVPSHKMNKASRDDVQVAVDKVAALAVQSGMTYYELADLVRPAYLDGKCYTYLL